MRKINVIKQSRDFTREETYKLTLGQNTKSVKDVPDQQVFQVVGFIYYTSIEVDYSLQEEMSEEHTKNLLSIETDLGVYVTESKTFISSFLEIAEYFKDYIDEGTLRIKKVSGESKNGRKYVDCEIP